LRGLKMLRNILFIAKKDFLYSLKEKTLLMWLFVMPLVFFGFIGSTTGGFAGNSTNSKQNVAIWEGQANMSRSNAIAKQIVYRLQQENFATKIFNAEIDAQDLKYHFKDYTRRLWLPADLQQRFEAGEQIEIKYASKASGLGQDKDQFSIEKALYQTLGDILLVKKTLKSDETINFEAINQRINTVELEILSAGEKQNIPSGFNQAVPGILVMFIMMIALTNGAVSLFLERQSGVLKRLAATPVTRKEIILGKWLGKWFITLLQMVYGMLVGWLLFKIHWGNHLLTLVLILMVWAAFNAALAVVLGSIASSEGQVSGVATVSSMLLAALGGCWWPIEITPQWMQNLAQLLPTGWMMNIMHQLMYFGGHLSDIIFQIIALIVISIVALSYAFRKFNYS